MFVSVDGKAREIAEIFAGGADGKAHKVTELFGSVDGTARQLWTDAPPVPNAFDTFSWAEIKQLANEGKLLEHFHLYDKVWITLKTPLTNTLHIYMSGYGVYKDVPQYQEKMLFQIVELTETKMRLMCPRVSVMGQANSDPEHAGGMYWSNWQSGNKEAREHATVSWGLTAMYTKLKTIQNSLPDDLVDVLSVCARPLIRWARHPITNSLEKAYDEDMKVRQVTSNVWNRGVDTTTDYYTVYPVIHSSYYPTTVGEYLYHIQLPEEYDTYTQRRYMVENMFKGLNFLDCEHYVYDNSNSTSKAYFTQSYCTTPFASCYYSKGITTNEEYEEFLDEGDVHNVNGGVWTGEYNNIFPEIIIEKS